MGSAEDAVRLNLPEPENLAKRLPQSPSLARKLSRGWSEPLGLDRRDPDPFRGDHRALMPKGELLQLFVPQIFRRCPAMTHAIPPRMASEHRARRRVKGSLSRATPPRAVRTGTLSCTEALLVGCRPFRAVYQMA